GIKPLYYARVGDRLVFGSELKALLALPELPREIDWSAFAHYLAFLTTPGDRSILRGIRKLPPGHVLIAAAAGQDRIERYWSAQFVPDHDHGEAWFVERLRGLLEESVRLHLVSDVPLGAFLSGGIDSSSVVASMTALAQEPVRTFSVGFAETGFNE